MKHHYFKEEQRVRQPWIYVLLLAVFGLWMWQLVQQVFMDVPFGTNPSPDWFILLLGLIPIGAVVLIFMLKLETKVDASGVHYRMWPIHKNFRHIPKEDILRWEVVKYKPLLDYGGWGVRQGFGKKGMAFNMSGNIGARFELKTGKKILIGTKKPEELRSALRRMKTPAE